MICVHSTRKSIFNSKFAPMTLELPKTYGYFLYFVSMKYIKRTGLQICIHYIYEFVYENETYLKQIFHPKYINGVSKGCTKIVSAWWRHQMETFSALLAICAGTSPVPHKGLWHGALMSSLICVWINGWVNSREAGDLRRYRGHYDIKVMDSVSMWHIHTKHNPSYRDWVAKSIIYGTTNWGRPIKKHPYRSELI